MRFQTKQSPWPYHVLLMTAKHNQLRLCKLHSCDKTQEGSGLQKGSVTNWQSLISPHTVLVQIIWLLGYSEHRASRILLSWTRPDPCISQCCHQFHPRFCRSRPGQLSLAVRENLIPSKHFLASKHRLAQEDLSLCEEGSCSEYQNQCTTADHSEKVLQRKHTVSAEHMCQACPDLKEKQKNR